MSSKRKQREEILAARQALLPQTHACEAAQLAGHAAALARGTTVTCAYVPVGTEPGSLALLAALRAAGTRVLLPLTGEPSAVLNWAEFIDAARLSPARHGLLEPTGPSLGTAAIAGAELVLLPALAVDVHGTRLGRGAGYYDRSLEMRSPNARLVAVVRAAEVLATLPREPHDIPVQWALTPAGLIRLGQAL